jgi:hypothetical protein
MFDVQINSTDIDDVPLLMLIVKTTKQQRNSFKCCKWDKKNSKRTQILSLQRIFLHVAYELPS